eukprot:CAMPEP_0113914180 /NCGR_PEP_ID=MMETSP0780_2-20120614/30188_1 /TAXON_ID=652834 /ORGANISM="Palpitomonas bilix" /LENGTH=253 /DNA_ID=CAMNT_0000911919 /DNA_START=55 /DNA_END=816 /DNA_ORIENTATION=+ /assembly_acc=CAM_ASM_000599
MLGIRGSLSRIASGCSVWATARPRYCTAEAAVSNGWDTAQSASLSTTATQDTSTSIPKRKRGQGKKRFEGQRGNRESGSFQTTRGRNASEPRQSLSAVETTVAVERVAGDKPAGRGQVFGAQDRPRTRQGGRGRGYPPRGHRPEGRNPARAKKAGQRASQKKSVMKTLTSDSSVDMDAIIDAYKLTDVEIDFGTILKLSKTDSGQLSDNSLALLRNAAFDVEMSGRFKPQDQLTSLSMFASRLKSLEQAHVNL